jgi:DCN1-like protein 1/2
LTLTSNTITFQATETAQAFWATLIPHGLHGGALAHIHSTDDDEDDDMGEEEGWQDEHVQWWFDFLAEKGGKGISKDTWTMVSRPLSVV